MANYPAAREIPEGKVLLAECGATNVERAIVETIAEAFSGHVAINCNVRLEWSSPGFELAGSALRWTNGFFACRWTKNARRFGRCYANTAEGEDAARKHFERLTISPEA